MKKNAFTFIEILIAVTVGLIAIELIYSIFAGFRNQSVKGTSVLDSTVVFSDIHYSLQKDLISSKNFEVKAIDGTLVAQVDSHILDGKTSMVERSGNILLIESYDGKKIEYKFENSSLVRNGDKLGKNRVKAVSFLPLSNLDERQMNIFNMLLVRIEIQPETDKLSEQHKPLIGEFIVAPPI